ncbi:MAG TPA: hypothetical protein VFY13_10440 [Luteolibacter sp.]|nr:hypothetical protein [Luteolibacter sp.]
MPVNVMIRKWRDPGDTSDLPKVFIHRPGPVRDKPLEGLKKLSHPEASADFRNVMAQRLNPDAGNERLGRVLGWVALGLALNCVLVFLLSLCGVDLPEAWIGWTVLGFICLHVFMVFSQKLTTGRNLPGALSIPVLYVGYLAVMVGEWLFRLWIL